MIWVHPILLIQPALIPEGINIVNTFITHRAAVMEGCKSAETFNAMI
jgi:hypothetical protein